MQKQGSFQLNIMTTDKVKGNSVQVTSNDEDDEPTTQNIDNQYNMDGLKTKQIRFFTQLCEIGLDSLVPQQYRSYFSKNKPDGSFDLPLMYRDYVNSNGHGANFIQSIIDKRGQGMAFLKALKEPSVKAKYAQHQINDISALLKQHEDKIRALQDHANNFNSKIDSTLKAASEMNDKIATFKEASDHADKVMKNIQTHISLFQKRAKTQDALMKQLH